MHINAGEISKIIKEQIQNYEQRVDATETGTVLSVGDGIARVYGVQNAMSMELLEFPGGLLGMVLNLEEDNVGHDGFVVDKALYGIECLHKLCCVGNCGGVASKSVQ